MMKNLYTVLILSLVLILSSCEDNSGLEITQEDDAIAARLNSNECSWFLNAIKLDVDIDIDQLLKIDFSNNGIQVFNKIAEALDEGTWEVKDGKLIIANLKSIFEPFNGEWEIVEERIGYIKLQKGETIIEFEGECKSDDDAALKAELLNESCRWFPHRLKPESDANLEGLTIDFSGNNIHVYKDDKVVDEGSWEYVDGKVEFSNLSAVLEAYNGSWSIVEDRKRYLKLEKDDVLIDFESECKNDDDTNDAVLKAKLLNEYCLWVPSRVKPESDANLEGLRIDFSGNNIHAYKDNAVVDEGSWEFVDGKVEFSNLSTVLENYNGSWSVVEDNETYLKLEKDDVLINFEADCSYGDDTAELKANLLADSCRWFPHRLKPENDANLEGLTIDFSGNNIHVYDSEENVVDEGSWEYVDGKVIFSNLSQALEGYNGKWYIVEDREGYLKLGKEDILIDFEAECEAAE
ncbi:hypothetical protein [Tenacibaculum agarivorans]|uniref:hypothetical protein n=1 Tax=Tenacibaculum agarivorans TaxID=1908389 RepID=UPI00117F52C6|nr:hypothetical protein [Tenacibaculum agarivorans]